MWVPRTEAVARRCSVKKGGLRNFAKIHSNFIKNRNSGAGVFLSILRNFLKTPFLTGIPPVVTSTRTQED